MKNKLKCILSVDDDNDCNFLHKLLIEDTNRNILAWTLAIGFSPSTIFG